MPRSRYCPCGCAQIVTGAAEFRPGHGVRMMLRLRREAIAGDVSAFESLYSHGWTIKPAPSRASFGVEAEFFGMDQSYAVQVLRSAGFNADDDGYHHENRDFWRVTEDGSVSEEGCELVSPILNRTTPDFTDVKGITRTLRQNGAKLDRTCGLHVHHNAVGMTSPQLAETVAHWAMFQDTINMLLPEGRVSFSEYCRPMYDARHWFNEVATYGSMADVKQSAYNFGRYHAVSLPALAVHGTVEFRQHSGTLNGEKIENWVKLTRLFMDIGRTKSCLDTINQYGSEDSVRASLGLPGMLDYLGASAGVKDYCLNRARALGNLSDSFAPNDPEDAESQAGVECNDGNGDDYYCAACDEYHYPEDEDYDPENG